MAALQSAMEVVLLAAWWCRWWMRMICEGLESNVFTDIGTM
jgi:hypothetical protein